MKFSWKIVVLVLVIIFGLWLWTSYNGLVTGQGQVATEWSQVENSYQRRFDLIPNLVNTVRGAAAFEQDTFTAVTAARSQWQEAGSRGEQIAAAEGFESALSRLLVTVEAYPQLQATQAFRDLMTQLEGTENRIATARRDYNNAVLSYNLRVRRFPGNVAAGLFGFAAEEPFEAVPGSEVAPEVNFDSTSS